MKYFIKITLILNLLWHLRIFQSLTPVLLLRSLVFIEQNRCS